MLSWGLYRVKVKGICINYEDIQDQYEYYDKCLNIIQKYLRL